MEDLRKYNIKAVVNLTGISAHTLRAWEKRYNAVVPFRTDTNRRLYTHDDIQKIRLLLSAVRAGHTISSVAGLSAGQIQELLAEAPVKNSAYNSLRQSNQFENEIKLGLEATKNFDKNKFENILLSASVNSSKTNVINGYVLPLLEMIGYLWEKGEFKVVHEHFAVSILRTFLGNMLENSRQSQETATLITTTPEGFLHELGALIAAVYANDFGWNSIYLGPDLPPEEIANAVILNKANAVLLSLIYPSDDARTGMQLRKLRKLIGNDIPLVLTGKAASAYRNFIEEINGNIISNAEELKKLLVSLRS